MTTPADVYANLRALAYGLEQVLADAARNATAYRSLVKAKSFESRWGPLTFRRGEPSIKLPPDPLLEWARQKMPHEVVEEHTEVIPAQVRPTLIKTLKGDSKKPGRFTIVDGQVVDTQDGEVITWAVVEPAGEDICVMNLTPEAKTEAAELVAGRLAQIAATVAGELE